MAWETQGGTSGEVAGWGQSQGMGKEEQNNNLEDLVTDCYVVLGFGGEGRWRTIQV